MTAFTIRRRRSYSLREQGHIHKVLIGQGRSCSSQISGCNSEDTETASVLESGYSASGFFSGLSTAVFLSLVQINAKS